MALVAFEQSVATLSSYVDRWGADFEIHRCEDKRIVDRLWEESERMIREAGF